MIQNKTAYTLAIKSLKRDGQRMAFNASLFEKGLADNPTCERASLEYRRIHEAIAILEDHREHF